MPSTSDVVSSRRRKKSSEGGDEDFRSGLGGLVLLQDMCRDPSGVKF